MKAFASPLVLILCLILAACTKSSENKVAEDPQPTQKCKLVKVFDFNDPLRLGYDTIEYIYTDSVLTRVNSRRSGGIYYTFEYENGRIKRRNHFLNGTADKAYTDITYSAEGKIEKLADYGFDNRLWRTIEFSYFSGQLSKVLRTAYFSNGVGVPDWEFTYTFSGGNISRVKAVKFERSGDVTSIVDYSYDTKSNYFRKRPYAFLTDANFFSLEGHLYAYFFSENNIISGSSRSTPNIHQYIDDEMGNLSELIIGDKVFLRYEYQCN